MGYELDMNHDEHYCLEDLEDEQIRQFLLSEKEKAKERNPLGWQPEPFGPDLDNWLLDE